MAHEELLKQSIETYARLKQMYLTGYGLVSKVRDIVKTGQASCEEMVNFIYVLREMSKLADDLRKEIDGVLKVSENVCCMKYIMMHADTPENADPIRAGLATGSPRCHLAVRMPKEREEPELYYSIMEFFGIPKQALLDKTVKGHWPGICDKVSQLAEEGKQLPPGLDTDRTYPTYSLTVRARKSLDELSRLMNERRSEIRQLHEKAGLEEWKTECIEMMKRKG